MSWAQVHLPGSDAVHADDYPVLPCAQFPAQVTVTQLFSAQVRRSPEATAVDDGDRTLTYRELDNRANQLARHLVAQGVCRGTLVGLVVERSLEMVVSLVAILKAGGVFVPFDSRFPPDLLRGLRSEHAIDYLIAHDHLLSWSEHPWFDGARVIRLAADAASVASEPSEHFSVDVDSGDAMYVMFTSGSTGTPKGVVVPHRAVVRLVWDTNYLHFGEDEVFLQLSPIGFDASTLELWGSLLYGGRLVLAPPHTLALDDIYRVVQETGVTTLWFTAALFHLTVDTKPEVFTTLRQALFGGDVISPQRVEKIRQACPSCRLVHGYGPTENTTFTTCYQVPKDYTAFGRLPIGSAVARTTLYVLDESLRPVPPGVPGQLATGGDGVALGYLNRPFETAEKFVPDPFSGVEGARMYLTGDLVCVLPDGNLEFLGRVDNQVKINGHRVEVEAVELTIREHPEVRECAVLVQRDTGLEKRLVAFAELRKGAILTESGLRQYLAERLPLFSIPARLTFLPSIPIGSTGKVDRTALSEYLTKPIAARADAPSSAIPSEMATLLVELWSRILHREHIKTDQNFFDLGGTSLQLIELHTEIQRRLGRSFPITDLFQKPTIDSLAKHLSTASPRARAPLSFKAQFTERRGR